MEPSYVGANRHIDAMAVAWLFAQDYVFFNPDEITWDGKHHGISGAQINAAKVDEIPTFMADAEMYYQGMGELLMTLEQDEELIVPRASIHPGLYDAIREGDLTGITLFNLQACARAFTFLTDENESVKRSMLQLAGLEALIENPSAMACTYVISVDQRLTRGIPGFYQLIRRMFEDMRAYNEIDLPYILVFTAARNFDADQCLDWFEDCVDGAVSESIHVETNIEEWKAAHEQDTPEEVDDQSEGETMDARALRISMLQLLAASSELGSNVTVPQDLHDELDRAEAGDETIDLDDLERRLMEIMPEERTADLSNVTFEQGRIAKGRRFSVAVPDGWTVVEDYETGGLFGTTRPFVLVQGEVGDDANLENSDRIIYSGIGGDIEVADTYAACGTADLKWALTMMARYDKSDNEGLMGLRPNVVWDEEVEAVNTRCFVSQNQPNEGLNGLDIYINPYALDHNDALRLVFSYTGEERAEKVREFAKAIARTVELDKPIIPTCEQTLGRALKKKIAIKDFEGMVESFATPYIGLRQSVFTSCQYRYATNTDNFSEDECLLAGARGIAEFNERAESVFEKLLDAYDAQSAHGMTSNSLKKLLESLEMFDNAVFATSDVFSGADKDLVEREGVFKSSARLLDLRARFNAMKETVEHTISEEKEDKQAAEKQADEAGRKAEEERKQEKDSASAAEESGKPEEAVASDAKAEPQGWRASSLGAGGARTAEQDFSDYFNNLESRRADDASERLDFDRGSKDAEAHGMQTRTVEEDGTQQIQDSSTGNEEKDREACLLLVAELVEKNTPEDTAKAIEILQDFKDDKDASNLLTRLEKLLGNQAAESSAAHEKGAKFGFLRKIIGSEEEDGDRKRRLAIIGGAVVAVILVIVALIVAFGGPKIPDDAFTVQTSIGSKFETSATSRDDLIEDVVAHFSDSSHKWEVLSSTVTSTGTQQFHVKASLTDKWERMKAGSDNKVKTITTYNRKVEFDVLLSGSEASFYNYEVISDDMTSKDEEIKTVEPKSSSSSSSSSSSKSGSSSSSSSTSRTKCHLCGGSGRVKYYSGGAGSDYTWGICTACNGSGYE